jgi:hypothetical protein
MNEKQIALYRRYLTGAIEVVAKTFGWQPAIEVHSDEGLEQKCSIKECGAAAQWAFDIDGQVAFKIGKVTLHVLVQDVSDEYEELIFDYAAPKEISLDFISEALTTYSKQFRVDLAKEAKAEADARPVTTINLTPSWAGMWRILMAAFEHARTPEARKVATQELDRMARCADALIELEKMTADDYYDLLYEGTPSEKQLLAHCIKVACEKAKVPGRKG